MNYLSVENISKSFERTLLKTLLRLIRPKKLSLPKMALKTTTMSIINGLNKPI
jgi:hypothetical protein